MSDLRAFLRIDGDSSGAQAAASKAEAGLKQVDAAGREAAGGLGAAGAQAGRFQRGAQGAAQSGQRLAAGTRDAAAAADQAARGLRDAADRAGEFDRAADGAGRSALLMGAALAAGAALGVREAARLSGEWSDMTSRIRIATENLDYHGDATARLAEIADRTYSSLSLTAENWLLNAQALAEYGYGAEAGLDFTEALNNALVVSAARGQRAETVVNAMARGLALGELRGNEFNTVIMNGGRVTQALADALGITTGELREMAREGRLSTHVVVDAMISQMERLRAEAESMPATIEDAGVRTGNAILELVGGLDTATGASRAVAAEIIKLADAIRATAGDPEALAALAAQLETVWAAAQFIAGVALARWLGGVAVQARASAAAWLMKSEAAAISGRNAAAAAATEAAAVTGLRGAIMAAAQAELTAASVRQMHASGRVQAAAAAVRAAQAELALAGTSAESAAARARLTAAEAALTAARNAQTGAAARAAAAERAYQASLTASGAAMAGMRSAGAGLLAMLGGPWVAGLTAAAAAGWALHNAVQAERRAVEEAAAATVTLTGRMAGRIAEMGRLGISTEGLSRAEREHLSAQDEAIRTVAELTGEVGDLADERLRAAAAAKAQQLAEAELDRDQAERLARQARINLDRVRRAAVGAATGGGRRTMDERALDAGRSAAAASAEARELESAMERLATAATVVDRISGTSIAEWLGAIGDPGEIDRRARRVRDLAEALDLEAASLRAQAAAAAGGEAALTRWRIAEAGRQAVVKAGLSQDDEGAAAIRRQAEAVERLRIQAERVSQGWEMARAADSDAAALVRRTAAMAQGREAVEAYRIEEAALTALRRLGVETLDQLNPRERAAAEAAMAAARAREAQAIASERAEAAAAGEEDLSRRIAAEIRRNAALEGGAIALADYARAEFVRQEVERRGLEVTDAAAAGIIAKAEALFALQAAGAAAAEAAGFEQDLRLARLTNRERQIALRTEALITRIRGEQRDLAEEAVRAMARARAEAEAWAQDWAAAAGEMQDMMRDAFINSGELAFGELGNMLERELRRAIYDAMLAEPIRIVVQAVVGNLSGSLGGLLGGGKGGPGGAFGGLLGSAGTGFLLGQGMGLGSGNLGLDLGLSLGGAHLGGMAGGALIAGLKGTALGGLMGGAVGSALTAIAGPLGALAGLALGNLFGGKKRPMSTAEIVATAGGFQVGGQHTRDGGPGSEVGQLAQAISQSLNAAAELFRIDLTKIAGMTTTAGYVTGGNYKALGGEGFFGGAYRGAGSLTDVIGHGVSLTQYADAQALAEAVVKETILRAIAAGASDLSEAEARLVQTARTLEEAIEVIARGRGFAEAIDLAILQFMDPAEWQRRTAMAEIEAAYRALREEAEELIAAGLVTADVLGQIERLRELQIEDVMRRLGNAAGIAAEALERIQAGHREWLDRMMLGDLAPLSPQTQREEAFRQYEEQLRLAEAGDEEALRNITRYAERLLQADRLATSSAQARADLWALIMGDIDRLSRWRPEEPPPTGGPTPAERGGDDGERSGLPVEPPDPLDPRNPDDWWRRGGVEIRDAFADPLDEQTRQLVAALQALGDGGGAGEADIGPPGRDIWRELLTPPLAHDAAETFTPPPATPGLKPERATGKGYSGLDGLPVEPGGDNGWLRRIDERLRALQEVTGHGLGRLLDTAEKTRREHGAELAGARRAGEKTAHHVKEMADEAELANALARQAAARMR